MELLRNVLAIYIIHVLLKKRPRMKEFNKTDYVYPFPLPFSCCQKLQTQVQATCSAKNVTKEVGTTQFFLLLPQQLTMCLLQLYCSSIGAQHIQKTMNMCLQLHIYTRQSNRTPIPLRIYFKKYSKFSRLQSSG